MDSTEQPPTRLKPGRPEGAMSRLSREAIEQASFTGQLPHEILLSMARGEVQKRPAEIDPENGAVLKWKYTILDDEFCRDAAKAAAGYFAPKISTVEVIAGVSDHDLDRIIAGLAAEAGVSPGLDREGAASEGAEGAGGVDQVSAGAGGGRERRSAKRID